MYFQNRKQAAELLGGKLAPYSRSHPLILAIPRGAIRMGKSLADRLSGDLDVVLVHKIGAPGNPEYAIGSVSEFGTLYRSDAIEEYGFSKDYVDDTADAEIAKLKQRRKSYSPIRQPINPSGRTVIIVDDGIATGSTMLAAIRAIRAQRPERIIVASPVASPEAASLLSREVDKLIILDTPMDFYAISQFYEDFPQVTDEEVLQILSAAGEPPHEMAA